VCMLERMGARHSRRRGSDNVMMGCRRRSCERGHVIGDVHRLFLTKQQSRKQCVARCCWPSAPTSQPPLQHDVSLSFIDPLLLQFFPPNVRGVHLTGQKHHAEA
jgi:hypothetical protein